MTSPFFGEFMGTLVLILLGDGVVAGVLAMRPFSRRATRKRRCKRKFGLVGS